MMTFLKHFKPILTIADKETNTEEEKRQHSFLVYMGLLMSFGGLLWGIICIVNELYLPMTVPFTYIGITTLNFLYLYNTKNFIVSQNIQILISLLLPFFFQFFLGGFVASGGNVLWAVLAVFGSFTLRRKHMTIIWLILFILLVIFSGLVDQEAKKFDIGLSEEYIIFFFVFNFIMTITIIFTLYYYFVSIEEKARIRLNESLKKIKLVQNQLIESEKMASLGSLVSGVAHEINTPLGIVLTSISHIDNEVKKMESNYNEQSLTEEALKEYITETKQIVKIISNQLNNAVTLIKSFKNISVDQHIEDKREFNLKQYIDDIVISLRNVIKKRSVRVINKIDADIELNSYPSIFSQIFSNLIINSINHGFEYNNKENIIEISLEEIGETLILTYKDNGKGIDDIYENKIFDPFFTTKRGAGGSGLGLNIVYNLVTQKLGGTLKAVRISPLGLGFTMKLSNKIKKV